MNRRRSSLAASPLLIGAITTLIVVVAVFLSYNANNGLPFVPTYNIKVELPEASGLQPSNQVRIAGTRVGIVELALAAPGPAHRARSPRSPTSSSKRKSSRCRPTRKAIVQSVSAIGLKYLELEKGSVAPDAEGGADDPDRRRRANRWTSRNSSTCSTRRRGPRSRSTRTTSATASPAAGSGSTTRSPNCARSSPTRSPCCTTSPRPATGLHELFVALDRAASQTAPVAEPNAELVQRPRHVLHGLGAASRRRSKRRPGAGRRRCEQAIYSLPHEAPFYEDATEFMHLLRPSAQLAASRVAPQLGHAFSVGAVNLAAATALNTRLAESSQALAGIRRRTRSSRSASKTSRRRSKSATRCSPGSRPSRPTATTGRSRSATSRAWSRRTSASARSTARASCSRRPGRTTRATRPRRPPTGRRRTRGEGQHPRSSTTTTCTTTPTRT